MHWTFHTSTTEAMLKTQKPLKKTSHLNNKTNNHKKRPKPTNQLKECSLSWATETHKLI